MNSSMYRKKISESRSFLVIPLILSLLISIFLVYNSSSTYAYDYFGSEYYFLINQTIWIFVGSIMFFIIQKIPDSFFNKLLVPVYFAALFLLFFMLFPTPFSLEAYGARRWFLINPEPFPAIPYINRLGFQPSEFMKLLICLLLPKVLLSVRSMVSTKDKIIKYLIYLIVPVLLVLLEPDLKNAVLILCIGLTILFVSGFNVKYFFYSVPVLLALALLLIVTSPYRMERLKTYLGNDSGSSYHVKQINIALGSGGLFGVGLGQSRQKVEYLPEVVGDSIFAILGEEFGFVGSFVLISILFYLFLSLYKSIYLIKDISKKLTVTGIFTWYGLQVFLNLGAVSGVIPLTGVPLPLISYGGSSLLFIMSAIAFVYKYIKS
ncbi:hypothetical protein COV24_05015 [candidate division WWE3 bacterium CG10_big_fil_rev_8_21_14_0_10_32_10]|uniref:Probable peptidoglycan glycosyltransferase FtsW n=1 Tax=candidate division WWE3 bacterium CG10_big_fil_rev_8_21_14_0_10_32_10 TaxID=1975090 RepID=A0A2H0R9F5_UNCKA|nr:MAG: hypothetical protein COV24_05015 [candidate division WWE3 bacterium CG10_big_fil_rev_8_21_14_0_10_32_10]